MAVQARIPVRIYFDDHARNWQFHVPELRIIGGGQRTRDEARQAAAEAIAYLLESRREADDGGPFEYLNVAVD